MLPNLLKRTLLLALVVMVTAGQAVAQLTTTREVTTSQLSQGVGATGDSAASAGGTGSLSAKTRLMTTQLNTLLGLVNTIGSTTSGSSGALGLCGVTTSAPTYTTGQNHPCSLQTDGSLRVYLTGASNGSVSNDDDGTIADGGTNHTTVVPLNYAWNSDSGVADWTRLMHQPLDFDSGGGTENLSVIGIGLPGSGGPVIGGTTSNPFATSVQSVPADPFGANADAASATGSISAKLKFIAQTGIPITGTVQVQSNSANLATQTTLAAIQTAVELIDNDQTGASLSHYISVGSTEDEHQVKGSAGRLFAINVTNTNAAVRYLRCANQVAASTTPGTTTVFYGMAIPAQTTGAGYTTTLGPKGVAFSTGLTCWLVTGAAETDVAEVAANEINVNYVYE